MLDRDRPTNPPRHDYAVILFHWMTALLVLILFALAEIWSFLPDGHLKDGMQSLHVSLGILLTGVLVLRIIWRVAFARSLPPAATGIQHVAAIAMHLALYLVLASQVVLGLLYGWGGGPVVFFGLFSIPSPITISPALNDWVGFLHAYNAWLIMGLAGAHAVAAILHHSLQRDTVLFRMIPLRRE